MKLSKKLGKRFLAVLLVAAIIVPFAVNNGSFNASAAATTASVNASSLNVRAGPGTNYSVVASVKKGTEVAVLNVGSNGWNQIQLPNSKTGYVSATYLTIKTEQTPIDGAATSVGTVINASLLNVRSGPGTSYSVKAGISGGTQVTVISTSNGWSRVILPNGTEGYVSNSYLSIKSGSTTTTAATAPAVPTGLSISAINATGATFKWNAVSGATEYQVNVSGGWITVTGQSTTTHVRTGLKANTSYDYCIRAKNAVGYSAWSAYGYFKTTSSSTVTTNPTTAPAVPTGLSISAITTSGATFKWNAVSGATEYQMNVSGGWVTLVGANNTTNVRTGLKANTSYDYCVRAKNAVGYSAWSSYGYFKTLSTSAPVATTAPTTKPTTVPAVPTGVSISYITSNGATFKWNAVSGATEYQVNVSGGWTTVAGANTTTFSHTALKANTSYDYCIRAKNAVGYGAWSSYGYFKTLAVTTSAPATPKPSTPTPVTPRPATPQPTAVTYTPPPTAITTAPFVPQIPTSMANTATGKLSAPTAVYAGTHGNQITVTWPAVTGVNNYKVNLSANHVKVVNKNSYTFTGLQYNKAYDFNVMSIDPNNSNNDSAWSKTGYITSGGNVPKDVKAYVKGNRMTIMWTPVTGATGYKVNTNGDHRIVPAGKCSYTYENLTVGTTYDFNVCAILSGGAVSQWSPTVGTRKITTSTLPAEAPDIVFNKGGNKMIFSNEPEAIAAGEINKPSYTTALPKGIYDVTLAHANSTGRAISFGIYIWNDDTASAEIKLLKNGTSAMASPNNVDGRERAAKNYEAYSSSNFTIPAQQGRWIYFANERFTHDASSSGDKSGTARSIPAGEYFEGLLQFETNRKIRLKMGPYTGHPNTTLQGATYQGVKVYEAKHVYSGVADNSTITANLKWTLTNATSGMLSVKANGAITEKWGTHLYDLNKVANVTDVPLVFNDLVNLYVGNDQFRMTPSTLMDTMASKRAGLAWNCANWFVNTQYNLTFTNTASYAKTVSYHIELPKAGILQTECTLPGGSKQYKYPILQGTQSSTVFSYSVPAGKTVIIPISIKLLGNSSGYLYNYIKVS